MCETWEEGGGWSGAGPTWEEVQHGGWKVVEKLRDLGGEDGGRGWQWAGIFDKRLISSS